MRYTEQDRVRVLGVMKTLAKAHHGECLSIQYRDNRTKLRWRCSAGHEWGAIPLNVRRGHWCAVCGNERQGRAKAHSIELMQKPFGKMAYAYLLLTEIISRSFAGGASEDMSGRPCRAALSDQVAAKAVGVRSALANLRKPTRWPNSSALFAAAVES
jgi:hypothetical protein